MGVTKAAKKVTIMRDEIKVVRTTLSYSCPSCYTTFKGDIGVSESTTRFRCDCGQELIVKKIQGLGLHK